MGDPLRPASTVGALIAALSNYPATSRVGVVAVGQAGISVELVSHQVVAVDCSLEADGRVGHVWVVASPLDTAEEPPAVRWTCPNCRTSAHLRDGDEMPTCCS